MAQRDRHELAEGREKRAVVTRDVPGDWFLDPADPEAGTRYSSNLDLEEAGRAVLLDLRGEGHGIGPARLLEHDRGHGGIGRALFDL